jgi:alpha,alpha-trehalase
VKPEEIEAAFRNLLADFIGEYFQLPSNTAATGLQDLSPMEEHIDNLWTQLSRQPQTFVEGQSTLIPLPYPYIVPGGRFREIYYWDSYFTCEGLAASGRIDLVENMVRNFAYLIDQFGHIPNGNRIYYTSRSQPPFFYKMLELLEREKGFDTIREFLPQLKAEHQFWTQTRHAVRLKDGSVLNRYWDEQNTPREESYAEDTALFNNALPEHQGELYRHIRSAAESGWDFSSRWFRDGQSMSTIRTTEILAVDLNSLLYQIELHLSQWLNRAGDPDASAFINAAQTRAVAIQKYFWDESKGWFFDYSITDERLIDVWSLAGVYPLFCDLASDLQTAKIAENIHEKFLRPGGVVTTLTKTGQQWDSPNGWAPLQWITAQALLETNRPLALEIAHRFLNLVEKVYASTGKMMEKYNVCDLELEAGGGEYPLQDGFGWTNGVVKKILQLNPSSQ